MTQNTYFVVPSTYMCVMYTCMTCGMLQFCAAYWGLTAAVAGGDLEARLGPDVGRRVSILAASFSFPSTTLSTCTEA